MALQKKVIKDNGIETNYHRITNIELSIGSSSDSNNNLCLNARLESYLNEDYRNKDLPIDTKIYFINIDTDEIQPSSTIREFVYNKLKELPEWSDAVDC